MEISVFIESNKNNWFVSIKEKKSIIKQYVYIGEHIYETVLDLLNEYKNNKISFYLNKKNIKIKNIEQSYYDYIGS